MSYIILLNFVIEDFIMTTSIGAEKENNYAEHFISSAYPTHQGKAFKI